MAFGLPIRWRGITRGSAASRDVSLIPKISYIIRHCKFVSQGACIFLKKTKKTQNDRFFSNWKKKTRGRKKLSLNRVFQMLNNDKWKMQTGARARKQKYISIYISLYLKTFLKTGVYIYIIQLDVHRRSQDSALLAVKERNRPVGELLKSWVHGCLIQACFVGHRKGDPLFS